MNYLDMGNQTIEEIKTEIEKLKNSDNNLKKKLNIAKSIETRINNISKKVVKKLGNKYSTKDIKVTISLYSKLPNNIYFSVDVPKLRSGEFGYYEFNYIFDTKKFSSLHTITGEWKTIKDTKKQEAIKKMKNIVKNIITDKELQTNLNIIQQIVDQKIFIKKLIYKLTKEIEIKKLDKEYRKLSNKEIKDLLNYLKNNTDKNIIVPVKYITNYIVSPVPIETSSFEIFTSKSKKNRVYFYIKNWEDCTPFFRISFKNLKNLLNNIYIPKNSKII